MSRNAQLAGEQWTRYTYVRDTGHLDYVDKAQRCEDFFAGFQWDQSDKDILRSQRRPGLTINKVLGTLSNIMGEQIDLQTETAFKARMGAPSGNADTLTKLFKYCSDSNQLKWLRQELFADGAITSRGYLDLRMDFTHSLAGDIVVQNLNPKNVIPDPDADSYDPDGWKDVLVTKWLTADDIEFLYNKEDADQLRNRATSEWAYGYDSIDRLRDRFAGTSAQGMYINNNLAAKENVSRMIRVIDRQHRKLVKMKYFVNLKTGDRRAVPLSWDRNKIARALEPYRGQIVVDDHIGFRIRWTVTAEDFVLHDEWSPYQHFTIVPYFPYFRYGRTIGLVENLLDPQELLNKSVSSELHAITTMANSGWKLKKNSLKNMTPDELEEFGSKSGLVLELDHPDDAEKIQPNQIPQGLSDLSRKGDQYMKTVSMRGDAQTGMARADVSADQIEAQNQASDTGLRKPLENLARSDFIFARNWLELIQEFYTDPRVMTITNNALTGDQEEFTINWPDPNSGQLLNDLTLGDYTFSIISAPAKQTLESSQFEQAAMMREKLGIAIPDEFMIENSSLINKTSLVKALRDQQNSAEAQAQKQLQIMGQKLEVANLKAEAARVEADAVLKRAKAAKEIAQTEQEAGGDATAVAEMQLKEREHQQEMAHDREKHQQEMQIEREKHAHDVQMKEKESEDKRLLARAQAIQAMRTPKQDNAGKPKEKA